MNPPPELMTSPGPFNQVTVKASVTSVISHERVAVVPEPTSCPAIVTPASIITISKKHAYLNEFKTIHANTPTSVLITHWIQIWNKWAFVFNIIIGNHRNAVPYK